MSRADEPAPTGTRLERALDLFLSRGSGDDEQLLRDHPDLRELLEPMLGTSAETTATGADALADEHAEVLGDYRLVREIGRGGMGIVYEAWQRSLDRRVAVKVLTPGLVQNPSAIARFHREAAAAGRLRHPHLVEVYGFGSANGQHFFAMQLVDGESLQHCKTRFREPAKALLLATQITEALVTAHAAGIVHRDVKPANILVREDGNVLLTDFGVASDESLPSLTKDGGFVGTLDHASPEQVRGERADARADVWAMGVVLAELLTGVHPFVGSTQQATLRNILASEPAGLAEARHLSYDIRAVVGRALEKAPTRRYASAAALLADLRALLRGAPVSARLPNAPERLMRWTRREPWRAFAALLLSIGLAGGAAALGYLSGKRLLIEAGERQATEKAREEALGWAWLAIAESDFAGAERHLAAAPDEATDVECRITAAWIAASRSRTDEALAILAGLDTPSAHFLTREWSAARRGEPTTVFDESQTAAAAGDPLTCFARGCYRVHNAALQDDGKEACAAAMRDFQATLLMSRTPRLSTLLMLMRAAAGAGDREQVDIAYRALVQRGAPTDFLLHNILLNQVAVDPAAALATLRDQPEGDPWLHLAAARALFALQRHAEARQECERYLAVRADQTTGWNMLGQIHDSSGDAPAARDAFHRATALDPQNAKAWNNLGTVQQRLGEVDAARDALQRALSIEPDYALAHYNLARLADAARDWPEAEQCYRRALAAAPRYAKAQINLATALWRQRKRPEALAEARRALALAPDNPIAVGNVAQFAYACGEFDEAERACGHWLELSPRSPKPWEMQARLLFRVAEENGKERGLSAARSALELSGGNDPELMLLTAHGEQVAGDTAVARQLIERLVRGLDEGSVPEAMRARIDLLQAALPK